MYIENSREKEITVTTSRQPISPVSRFTFHLRLIDYATFLYLGVVGTLLLFFHRGVEYWPWLIVAHAVLTVGLLLFFRFAHKNTSRIVTFVRDAYPFFLYTFLFKEVSIIVNIFFPFWLEGWLIKWDLALFGNHPTLWLQKFYRPWLTELMAFSYWSYYVFIPFVGFTLYFRKGRSLFYSYVFHLSLTLYICYFLFLFLCARGPHETLASLYGTRELVGIFDRMVYVIQSNASISGAAFPSSHVAAVWVGWIFLFKFKKRLGWLTLPLIAALSFSVVYMGYHYAVDSMAGILLLGITFPAAKLLENKFIK